MKIAWMIAQVEGGAPRGLTPQDRSKLLVALAVLLGLVIVGGVIILMVRRRLHGEKEEDPASGANTGFSLADLREMVKRGELTQEEYDRTKARIVAKVRSAADKPKRPPTVQ